MTRYGKVSLGVTLIIILGGLNAFGEDARSKATISAPPDAATATLTIDGGKILGPVNYKALGQILVGADSQYIWSNDLPNWEIREKGNGVWDPKNEKPVGRIVDLFKTLRPGVIRYPGGSEAKNYNWKLLVGPLEQRQQNWHWGLVEFLTFCRAVGAEPQICLSEYVGGPEDQRDLVEFLNAPPTAEHPWAQKRAHWGHPEPFGVKYFELGNEPYDGNRRVFPRRQWDAKGYCNWAKQTAQLLRTVDPTVKIGLPEGFGEAADAQILKEVGPLMDFYILHTYPISYAGNLELSAEAEKLIMQACMAAGEQAEAALQKKRAQVVALAGKDLDLGITEYNVHLKSQLPRQYRRSFGAGIFCADYLLRMLEPQNRVLLANYHQMLNGYWGSIHSESESLQPPYYCQRFVANHLGDNLVEVKIDCPTSEFAGFCDIRPAGGTAAQTGKIWPNNLFDYADVYVPASGKKSKAFEVAADNGEIRFSLNNFTGSSYPGFATIHLNRIPAEFRPAAGVVYNLSFEACFQRQTGSAELNLGIGIMDGRGWEKAGSAIGVEGVDQAEWKSFSGLYSPLKDTTELALLGRLLGGSAPVSGVMRVRKLAVQPAVPDRFPAYRSLNAIATQTADTLRLLVINKDLDRSIQTTINLCNFQPGKVALYRLNAPEAASTAEVQLSPEEPLVPTGNQLHVLLEPHSLTALTITSAATVTGEF